MIPKIIHYCWFGGNSMPDEYKKYIDSWRKFCPDYEIKEWNESNYDMSKNKYMFDAYNEKKWGFVPDYARFDIIYEHGGFYLDTDVELLKPLDELLHNKAYLGFENDTFVNGGIGFGAEKGNRTIKDLRDMYDGLSFYNEDGSLNTVPSPFYITRFLESQGLLRNNSFQIIGECTIYPKDFFSPKDYNSGEIHLTCNSVSIHHFDASWFTKTQKKIKKIEEHYIKKYGVDEGGRIARKKTVLLRLINKIETKGVIGTVTFAFNKISGGGTLNNGNNYPSLNWRIAI